MIYLQMIDTPADRSKFEQLYLEYRGLMFYVANKILQSEQDAEDAVHQAFLSVAENIEKIGEPDSPKTQGVSHHDHREQGDRPLSPAQKAPDGRLG